MHSRMSLGVLPALFCACQLEEGEEEGGGSSRQSWLTRGWLAPDLLS